MGKKVRCRSSYTSKGTGRNVSKKTLNLCKADEATKAMNKLKAWRKGLNPWITIRDSATSHSGRLYRKVKANDLWGNPKNLQSNLFKGGPA